MQTLTREIIDSGLANRIIRDEQLTRILDGSDQRRYHLVNRALRAGELIRLRRGVYALPGKLRDNPVHPFALAQALEPGSYVSLESALSFHGWIPEGVYETASILPGRKSKTYSHEQFGLFSFHPLAVQAGYFLELVERLQTDGQTMLVAKPVRALMDLVCLKRVQWQGLEWLLEGLRIEMSTLRSITGAQIRILREVYKLKQCKVFLDELARDLGND